MITVIGLKRTKKLACELASCLELPCIIIDRKTYVSGEIEISSPTIIGNVILVGATVTNDDWIELFLTLNVLKNVKIHLILSYTGYARQHCVFFNQSSGFSLFLNLLDYFNLNGVTFIDCHSEPMLKTFCSHISVTPLFVQDIKQKYLSQDLVLVSPDIGRIKIVQSVCKSLNCHNLAVCLKNRLDNNITYSGLLGNVYGKKCILVDDMVDSGKTLLASSTLLMHSGAKEIIIYVTHSVSTVTILRQLAKQDSIHQIVLTNTILKEDINSKKIRVLSITPILEQHIKDSVLPMLEIK